MIFTKKSSSLTQNKHFHQQITVSKTQINPINKQFSLTKPPNHQTSYSKQQIKITPIKLHQVGQQKISLHYTKIKKQHKSKPICNIQIKIQQKLKPIKKIKEKMI